MPDDSPTDEARVRVLLGLSPRLTLPPAGAHSERPTKRHRFVRDGEIPVERIGSSSNTPELVGSLRSRLAEADRTLRDEQRAHEQTQRALAQAQAVIRALEAQRAHAEFAHGEAVRSERIARESAEAALEAVRVQLRDAEARIEIRAKSPESASANEKRFPRTAKPRPRTDDPPGDEPAPIEWWVSGWRQRQ